MLTFSFLALVQHRFASHCCEALFLRSAPIVTEELVAGTRPGSVEDGNASMEQLFLQALDELQGNMGFLMTHRFASHALRVLLLIFSGRSLTDAASQALLKGKNKENIGAVSPMADELNKSELRPVPGTFNKALDNIISGMVGGLDPNYLRALATQPLGNPVLQLLLQIEFGRSGKQKAKDEGSLFRKLLPEMPPDEGTTSALFIRGLLYDPTGSHLLETIVTCSPGKAFKSIYHGQLYDNLRSIVKNENASYVLIKALERLSPGDLQEVLSKISPEISNLIEQSRTSVLRSLIERYHVRKLSDESIEKEISSYFGPPSAASLRNMLGLDAKEVQADPAGGKDREKSLGNRRSHAALLLQKMLEHPGSLRRTVHGALLEATPETLIEAALDKSGTYVVQKSLGCEAQTKGFRRTLLQKFQGRESKLALDMTGAHVLDAFWRATMDLHFLREQIAQQLAKNEEILKESASGRIVRRRWLIDLYVNKRSAWVQKSKRSDLLQDNGENRTNSTELSGQKTSIDMARERFAAKKATKSIWKAPRTHNTTLEGPLSKKYLKPSEDGKLSQRGQQNTTVETPG